MFRSKKGKKEGNIYQNSSLKLAWNKMFPSRSLLANVIYAYLCAIS